MKLTVEAVNHVCVVVKDMAAAEDFYIGVLGLKRHHRIKSWLLLNEVSTLHLVHIPEATVDTSLYHEIQHFALQVPDLRGVVRHLFGKEREMFQMDFEGVEKSIDAAEAPLDHGLGTVFTRDPDGNLIEFLQLGQGIFKGENIRNIAAE
jgi:catechol 2,3-dioxygenase-like lactoylglutathione lyase family enzyme